MSGPSDVGSRWTGRLRGVVIAADSRVRATWRVVLAWPVLWFAAGSIGIAAAGAVVPLSLTAPATMLGFGLFQLAFSGAAVLVWARLIDRRPLVDYGFSLGSRWLLDLVVGFAAVFVGHAVWGSFAVAAGWATIELALVAGRGTLVGGLVLVFLAVLVNVVVQETVFVGVTARNAAEGLASRSVTPSRAVLGAWAVATVIFVLKHRPPSPERLLNLVIALGVFAALYAHTGELALSIGVHTGINFAGNVLFAAPTSTSGLPRLFIATTSFPGLVGGLHRGAIPPVLIAYALLLGWLRWRDDAVGLATGLTEWTPR